MEESSPLLHLKKSTAAIRKSIIFFLSLLLCNVVVSGICGQFDSDGTDSVMLLSNLIDVIFSMIIYILFVNRFFANLTNTEFSFSKSMWDIPTYVYFELLFGLLFLASCLLVIPGLIVFFLFSFSPVVAIILDNDEVPIFKKTYRLIRMNLKSYTYLLIPLSLLSILGLVFERIGQAFIPMSLFYIGEYILSLAILIMIGSIVSLLSKNAEISHQYVE